jgi:hypothetical protein
MCLVTDDGHLVSRESLTDPGDIRSEREGVVSKWGLVAVAIASQVKRAGSKTGQGQREELMSPSPPELWEAVKQKH